MALGQDASHPGTGNRSLEGQYVFTKMNRTKPLQRLRNFEESLGESERKAENLRQEQKLQSEAFAVQSRAQESLQLSIEISQALLDKAAASASNLQVMVEDAVSKYTDLPIFTGPWGQHSAWTVSAVLFSIIGALNPRVALAVLFIGSSK